MLKTLTAIAIRDLFLFFPDCRQYPGYVGLVNQAMTCYLNSLLQTLFMTPEFRNAVYRWDYDGSMEVVKCREIMAGFMDLSECVQPLNYALGNLKSAFSSIFDKRLVEQEVLSHPV